MRKIRYDRMKTDIFSFSFICHIKRQFPSQGKGRKTTSQRVAALGNRTSSTCIIVPAPAPYAIRIKSCCSVLIYIDIVHGITYLFSIYFFIKIYFKKIILFVHIYSYTFFPLFNTYFMIYTLTRLYIYIYIYIIS